MPAIVIPVSSTANMFTRSLPSLNYLGKLLSDPTPDTSPILPCGASAGHLYERLDSSRTCSE